MARPVRQITATEVKQALTGLGRSHGEIAFNLSRFLGASTRTGSAPIALYLRKTLRLNPSRALMVSPDHVVVDNVDVGISTRLQPLVNVDNGTIKELAAGFKRKQAKITRAKLQTLQPGGF